jgi:hypothetical protein
MKGKAILFFLVLSFTGLTCKHDVMQPVNPIVGPPVNPGTPCDPGVIYFEKDVLPILVSNCAISGCHNPGFAQDGVLLDNYVNVMLTGDVRPGNPLGSDLYQVIVSTDINKRMPPLPRAALSAAQITTIRTWIEQGAKNLACNSTSCDTSVVRYSTSIIPILQNKCIGCHSGAAPQGNVDLTTYANVKSYVTLGKFAGAVNHTPGFYPMPKYGPKLPDCDIAKIRIWIAAGSPNN